MSELKNGCVACIVDDHVEFSCINYTCKHQEGDMGIVWCNHEDVPSGHCTSKPARREAAETAVALGRAYLESEGEE